MTLIKFPRTPHLESSRLQAGDSTDNIKISELEGIILSVEEKVDGANCGISFDENGELLLQSRGHYLSGGHRERHFNLFKTWANAHAVKFHEVIGSRYIIYGEWMYAKHTVFYDHLPHYFLEFDVFDRSKNYFLSTRERRKLLGGLPIMSVPVLFEGEVQSVDQVAALVRPSQFKSENWRKALYHTVGQFDNRIEFVEKQTEDSDLAEGLYFRQEGNGRVIDRLKYVRSDFHQAIEASKGHWQDRPILPNRLIDGVDIFAPQLGLPGAYDS